MPARRAWPYPCPGPAPSAAPGPGRPRQVPGAVAGGVIHHQDAGHLGKDLQLTHHLGDGSGLIVGRHDDFDAGLIAPSFSAACSLAVKARKAARWVALALGSRRMSAPTGWIFHEAKPMGSHPPPIRGQHLGLSVHAHFPQALLDFEGCRGAPAIHREDLVL